MSLGSWITLLKSVLACIPMYFLSCFKCPTKVVGRIEKVHHNFLWNVTNENRKYHLANRNQVCISIDCGGLGIRPIGVVNRAMIGKWLWRVEDKSPGMQRQLLIAKYNLVNHGWIIPTTSSRASEMWKSILLFKLDFEKWIRFRVHNGRSVNFWGDVWCGYSTLTGFSQSNLSTEFYLVRIYKKNDGSMIGTR